MIEKMKFLSITGPKEDIDRVIDTYLSRYEIHLENALSELKTVQDLRPYVETNPYKEIHQRAVELAELLPPGEEPQNPNKRLSVTQAAAIIEEIGKQAEELKAREEELISKRDSLKESVERILPFITI